MEARDPRWTASGASRKKTAEIAKADDTFEARWKREENYKNKRAQWDSDQ